MTQNRPEPAFEVGQQFQVSEHRAFLVPESGRWEIESVDWEDDLGQWEYTLVDAEGGERSKASLEDAVEWDLENHVYREYDPNLRRYEPGELPEPRRLTHREARSWATGQGLTVPRGF